MSNFPKIEINDFDKLVHCLISMGLSGAIFFEQTNFFRQKQPVKDIFWATWIFPVLFMGGIELAQEYLPVSRTGDWIDFEANIVGATLGLIICLIINQKWLKN